MKKLLRSYLITSASLFIASRLISTITFTQAEKTVFTASLVLTAVNFFVKPILNLLLLPINLITLGFFRWLVNVFAFYIVKLAVPQMEISAFHFPGFTYHGFAVPEIQFSFFWTLVLISFIISWISSFLQWVFKK